MRLVSFSVTNYRSITKAYKLPIRQATILIGPNNEGKSNILRGKRVVEAWVAKKYKSQSHLLRGVGGEGGGEGVLKKVR